MNESQVRNNIQKSPQAILLINPPRSPYNNILKYAPQKAQPFIHKKLIGPPLGLLTVAEAVKEYSVSFLDMKGEYDLNPDSPDIQQLTQQWLEKSNPTVVGVTFIASEFYYGMLIFKTVKQFNPSILTIAGGPHTTLCPNDFAHEHVDIIIPGQSAIIFRHCIQALELRKDLHTVHGIMINEKNTLKKTQPIQHNYDSVGNDYIQPNRNFIKRWISTYKVGSATVPSTYLYTSQGCPYRCVFCSIWPQFNGQFYQRKIESIITELKNIDDYPIVRFADANSIVNKEFIERLFQRIEREHIKKEYIMDIRFDTVVKYPKLIEKLAKAGLKVVICGFESFRQKDLEDFNKSASASQISEAVSIFDANSIMVRGNYVIPPDYSMDDFNAMKNFAESNKVVYAGYTIVTPMPGTPLYAKLKSTIIDHDLRKYNFFNCVLKTTLPLEEFYYNVGNLWLIKKGTDVI